MNRRTFFGVTLGGIAGMISARFMPQPKPIGYRTLHSVPLDWCKEVQVHATLELPENILLMRKQFNPR